MSTCIVCGHKLSGHIDEGDQWRCHSIMTPDLNQCECRLRKVACCGEGIDWFNREKRVEVAIKEMKDAFTSGEGIKEDR